MTHDRDLDHVLDRWMDDGPTVVADRVIAAAMTDVHTTRQRGARRAQLKELFMTHLPQPLAPILGAVVLIVAGVGLYAALTGPDVGGPDPTPSPAATEEATMVLGSFATSEFAVPFRVELETAASSDGWAVTESPGIVTLSPDVNGRSRVIVLPREQTQLIVSAGARAIGDDLIADLNEVAGIEASQQTAFDTGEPATVTVGGSEVPWVIAEVDADEMPLFRTTTGETVTRPTTTESWWFFDVPGPNGDVLIIYRGGDDPGTWGGSVMFALESLQFQTGQ